VSLDCFEKLRQNGNRCRTAMLHDHATSLRPLRRGPQRGLFESRLWKRRHKDQNFSPQKGLVFHPERGKVSRSFDDNHPICSALAGKTAVSKPYSVKCFVKLTKPVLQDHTLKKLLLIFWEVVPKTDVEGRLMQEMILVSQPS